MTDDEQEADIIVINTCCFIHDAKEESIQNILEMAELKKEGKIGDVFPAFYTTAGVMTPMEKGKEFGEGIAKDLLANDVDAVILTST